MNQARFFTRQSRTTQKGVVLLIALIMLIAMTLVGVSLLRSVGMGSSIAGNLAFRQNATSVGDLGVEVARAWIVNTGTNTPAVLEADAISPNGYFATWDSTFNPLTYNWSNSRKLATADHASISNSSGKDDTGNEIRYVVHRLCGETGPVNGPYASPTQLCANYTDYSGLGGKGSTGYGQQQPSLAEKPYYRVTIRVNGPRKTTSYAQVIMY